MKRKLFVGTMFAGEMGLDECCARIERQKNVDVVHSVIKNLPEDRAHAKLWASWEEAKSQGCDAFLKVDADTWVENDLIADAFYRMCEADDRVTGIQAPLFDHFTMSFINGLNFITDKVSISTVVDPLYCDRSETSGHNVVIKSDNVVRELVPAGQHCALTTDIQAYHFGLHRALKGQRETLQRVKDTWKSNGYDRKQGMALLGASHAGRFVKNQRFSYTDIELLEAYQAALLSYEGWAKCNQTA